MLKSHYCLSLSVYESRPKVTGTLQELRCTLYTKLALIGRKCLIKIFVCGEIPLFKTCGIKLVLNKDVFKDPRGKIVCFLFLVNIKSLCCLYWDVYVVASFYQWQQKIMYRCLMIVNCSMLKCYPSVHYGVPIQSVPSDPLMPNIVDHTSQCLHHCCSHMCHYSRNRRSHSYVKSLEPEQIPRLYNSDTNIMFSFSSSIKIEIYL